MYNGWTVKSEHQKAVNNQQAACKDLKSYSCQSAKSAVAETGKLDWLNNAVIENCAVPWSIKCQDAKKARNDVVEAIQTKNNEFELDKK